MSLSPTREPVAYGSITAALVAALGIAVAFGAPITPDQRTAIVAAIPLEIAVIGMIVRQFTTPVAAPVIQAGTQVTVTPPPTSQQATSVVLGMPAPPMAPPPAPSPVVIPVPPAATG